MTNSLAGVIITIADSKKRHAPVVELADTLDLGSSARAWGFKSLLAHQKTVGMIAKGSSSSGFLRCIFFV